MSIFDEKNKKPIWGALRCAPRKYNKKFLNCGEIKFGTPQKWADDGEIYGSGRGDIFEGTFATCHKQDFLNMTKICKKYGIPNEFTDIKCFGDRVYYKDKRVMQLPTFCLYGGTFDDFIIQDKPGWQKIKGNIPPKYFQSFASIDGKKVSELPEDEQPSVVIFMKENFVDFKDKLYTKLQSIGVKKEEIICEFVHYIDFNLDWLDIRYNRKCPRELLIKEKQFAYQREIRFIINSSDKNIVEDLNKNTIDIGDLSGIAQYKDGYFEEGIDIEMDINLVEKNEMDIKFG